MPIVAVVDTNHAPDGIDYVIPGNDDSGRAVRLYARGMADAVLEGRSAALQDVVKGADEDEFVEVNAEEEEQARLTQAAARGPRPGWPTPALNRRCRRRPCRRPPSAGHGRPGPDQARPGLQAGVTDAGRRRTD